MATIAKRYQSTINAQQRRVCAYVTPKYHPLILAYAKVSDMKIAQVVNLALKHFFDAMPEDERGRILIKYRLSEPDKTS